MSVGYPMGGGRARVSAKQTNKKKDAACAFLKNSGVVQKWNHEVSHSQRGSDTGERTGHAKKCLNTSPDERWLLVFNELPPVGLHDGLQHHGDRRGIHGECVGAMGMSFNVCRFQPQESSSPSRGKWNGHMVRIISTHKHCTFLEKLASQFNSPELNKRNSMCGFLAVSSSSGPLLLLLEAPLASSLTAAFSSLPPPAVKLRYFRVLGPFLVC